MKYFVLLGFIFSFYMMEHYTLYIKQDSNKSVSKFSLSCFNQTPFVYIFVHILSSHSL